MSCAVLEIVYGERTFRLVGHESVFLRDWSPSTPVWVENAGFQSGPFLDGRRPYFRRFSNPTETLSIDIRGGSHDGTIMLLRQLQAAMEMAANYWTAPAGNFTPVYLKAQASLETNPRYAVVVSYQFGNLNNPFAAPFLQPNKRGYLRFDLVIERMHWTDEPPGTVSEVAVAGYTTYEDRLLGNTNWEAQAASETGPPDPDSVPGVTPTGTFFEAFSAAKHVEANLTHVYVDDGGVFGSNLMDATNTFNLLPSGGPVANDAVYFGITTTVNDSAPFTSLVFDLEATTYTGTWVWEYWNGSAWATLTTERSSHENGGGAYFWESGIEKTVWIAPSNWAANTVNGVLAWWVRLRISVAGTGTTPPRQKNRSIYTVSWNFIEIERDQVPGDIPALIQMQLRAFGPDGYEVNNGLIVGLRSYARGAAFQAYLNPASHNNPDGLTVTASAGVTLGIINAQAPCGAVAQSVDASTAFNQRVAFTFAGTLSRQYYGTHRAFVRAKTTDSTNSKLRLKIHDDDDKVWYLGEAARFSTSNLYEVLDLGVVNFFSAQLDITEGIELTIEVEFGNDDGTGTIDMIDLILMPVDEWACEINGGSENTLSVAAYFDSYGEIESARYPRIPIRSLLWLQTGYILRTLSTISSGQASLQPNSRQRLWFLPRVINESAAGQNPAGLLGVGIKRSSRYLTLRGDE